MSNPATELFALAAITSEYLSGESLTDPCQGLARVFSDIFFGDIYADTASRRIASEPTAFTNIAAQAFIEVDLHLLQYQLVKLCR